MLGSTRVFPAAAVVVVLLTTGGCGGTTTVPRHAVTPPPSGGGGQRAARHRLPPANPTLAKAGSFLLPEGRDGAAAASAVGRAEIVGGLSPAGVSTASVFVLGRDGRVATAPSLPGPVHDAAAAWVGGRLLLFGGGRSEGSDQIVRVMPGTPRVVGTLPVALSDLGAATIGGTAYVTGGWDGTRTNSDVFGVGPSGQVKTVGRLPVGVRYPAVAALDGRLIIAGGELTDGSPTAASWSFDPASGSVSRLPDLPMPWDHGTAASRDGWFYLFGGLRAGASTDQIIALRAAGKRWVPAGSLPEPVAKPAAAPLAGGLAVFGGQSASGPSAQVTLLRARLAAQAAR